MMAPQDISVVTRRQMSAVAAGRRTFGAGATVRGVLGQFAVGRITAAAASVLQAAALIHAGGR